MLPLHDGNANFGVPNVRCRAPLVLLCLFAMSARYYNGCLFYNVQQNFMIQTGDPTATGKGGTSAYGIMYGEQAR